ncbi:MAG: inositol monophosphatase family protein [Planctomycetota bacterium]|jgi:myo-inositol-1(or 4)-monophosphatase
MTIDHVKLSRILETAIVAARLAGQKAMEEMAYTKASFKNSEELVTQADSLCQEIIIDRIKETYPDHGFIAEEGPDGKLFKQPPRGTDKIWWIIDPIDGTNNFAHKMPLFCISIAAMSEGEPVVGVIFAPALESMFTAFKDGDAQLNSRRITAGKDDMNDLTSIGLDSLFKEEVPQWAQAVIKRTMYRNLGSAALQMAYVANGALIANINTGTKLWDMAAGTFIAQCAGALATNWKGQDLFPVDIDAYQGEVFDVLVANKKVHPQMVKLLNS